MRRMDNRQSKYFQFKALKGKAPFLRYKESKRKGRLYRRSFS